MSQLSIIIPAYNEAGGIQETVTRVRALAVREGWEHEVIVVDDGSTDTTAQEAEAAGARVVRHPMNAGYGLSLQHGIQNARYPLIANARYPLIAITDADGTYPIEELPALLQMVQEGFDMAVGARQGTEYKKGLWKYPARILFRWLAEYVAGRRIPDINSGLRIFRRDRVLPHLPYTCFGFSFTTSITLIFFLQGWFVGYRPIPYAKRIGASKVRHLRDTLRTAQIMVSIISRYNPIKLFLLIAMISGVAGLFSLGVGLVTRSVALSVLGAALIGVAPLIFSLGPLAESTRNTLPG